MTNDELAAAIQVASDRLNQTTSDHTRMWSAHLAVLLEVQAARAKKNTSETIMFRRPQPFGPPTPTDPLGQNQRHDWKP